MPDPELLERMRADWNRRADEDANYYAAFGRRGQDDREFLSTGSDVVRDLTRELKRAPGRSAALEIGCGPGRLMRPMSRHFGRIYGVDVSDQMICLAHERLRDVPNAFACHNSGADLASFPDETFDFVYSYAVFQHIPSKEVVFQYLREARRVLKRGGILRCQVNGQPPDGRQYDTWSGVRIGAAEVAEFAQDNAFQLLALEQAGTQYMWLTYRKPMLVRMESCKAADNRFPLGVSVGEQTSNLPHIRKIGNAHTGEAATPADGRLAAISLWIDRLPPECDLIHLTVTADGRPCRPVYIGPPERDGVTQVNAVLPEGIRTGVIPVEAAWRGRLLSTGWTRILPAPPSVPGIAAITDGVDLLSGARIVTGWVKVAMVNIARDDSFRATVDGVEAEDCDSFCIDPVARRYEFNFRLPPGIGEGPHEVRIVAGRRSLPPLLIEVA